MNALRRPIWTVPLLLGAGSLFALVAALAGEGGWDWIAWLLLALPLAVVAWFALTGRKNAAK